MALTEIPKELSSTPGIVDNSNATAITIDASENVGIGTNLPSTSLDIVRAGVQPLRLQSTSGTEVSINMVNTGGNVQLEAHSGNFNIDADAVGIGTVPNSWGSTYEALSVGPWSTLGTFGNADGGFLVGNAYHDGTNWKYRNNGTAEQYKFLYGAHIWEYAASGTAGNTISFSEAMRIDASGNLALGHTTTTGAKFAICDGANAQVQFFPEISTDTNLTQHYDPTAIAYMTSETRAASHSWKIGTDLKMTLDASGNVGIGVVPSAWATSYKVLQLGSASSMFNTGSGTLFVANAYIDSGFSWRYQNSSYSSRYTMESGGHYWYIAPSGTAGDAVGFTQAMTLDSSGNLGIGVVPSADSFFKSLEIGNTGSGITGRGAADTHFMSGLIWDGASTQEYTVSSVAVGKYQITNGIHSWATAPAGTAGTAATPQTNMTLDTSGNLLVGQSITTIPGVGNTTAGVSIRGQDGSFFSRILGSGDTNNVVSFNRSTEDGNILGFQKDGTTVGSIGTQGGDLNIGTGACGISFVDGVPALYPWTTTGNTTRDAAIDLGDANARFKDLHLSGGVVFGDAGGSGTPSSYTFDSYEEGTFTPVITGTTGTPTVTYSTQSGTYTKIGRTVYYRIGLRVSTISGGSGILRVTGLPFTAKSYGAYANPFAMANNGGMVTSQGGPIVLFVESGASTIQGRYTNTNADSVFPLGEIQATTYMVAEGFYETS